MARLENLVALAAQCLRCPDLSPKFNVVTWSDIVLQLLSDYSHATQVRLHGARKTLLERKKNLQLFLEHSFAAWRPLRDGWQVDDPFWRSSVSSLCISSWVSCSNPCHIPVVGKKKSPLPTCASLNDHLPIPPDLPKMFYLKKADKKYITKII